MDEKPIQFLSNTSTALVVVLSVFTLWLYPIWWFYSRISEINKVNTRKVTMWGVIVVGVFSVISLAFDFFWPGAPTLAANLLRAVYLVSYFVLVFTIKSEIEGVLYSSGISSFHLSPLLSFILSPIYFQYKINSSQQELINANT